MEVGIDDLEARAIGDPGGEQSSSVDDPSIDPSVVSIALASKTLESSSTLALKAIVDVALAGKEVLP